MKDEYGTEPDSREQSHGENSLQDAGLAKQALLPTISLALAGCLWGTGFLFGKIAFREVTVTENVTFRFVCGSAALLPVLLIKRTSFRGKDLWLLLVGAVVGVPVEFLLQFKGLQLTTVSHASLIVGALPVLLALSSVVFLGERLTRGEWGILLLSGVGTLLIALSKGSVDQGPRPTAKGDVLVLISMVAVVVMILITKRMIARHSSLE